MNSDQMQAAVFDRYGPPEVIHIRKISKPSPKPNEVLIKVHAAAVNTGDCELRSPKIPNSIWFLVRVYFGLFKPRKKVLGAYFAGTVEAIGSSVSQFKLGEAIYGCSGARFGAYAQYICLPQTEAIAPKPDNMTFEESAATPLGLDAIHFLRKAEVQPGEKVLINGAGGGIGTIAVQLAKHYGAEVTAVDHAEKLSMLRNIGADRVIDYTQKDFSTEGGIYDVVFDLVGKRAYRRCLRALKRDGRYILANPSGLPQLLRGLWTSATNSKKVISQLASANTPDLLVLKQLAEAGKLRAVVDTILPLSEVVAAHRYVESGQKKGSVLLKIG